MSDRRSRAALMAAAAVALLAALGAAGAQAAPVFHCEASPLRATILGAQSIEPVVQGRAGDCATGESIPGVALPSLVSASVLTARTDYDGANARGSANGGVASLQIVPSPEILATARQSIVDAINALPLQPITLPGLPSLPIPGLPSITGLTVDVRGALLGLIPDAVPSLLSADLLEARASVACAAGTPTLAGTSSVAGLKVLGQDLGADSVINTVLPLINSKRISLADLDLTKLKFYDPTGLVPIALGTLQPVLTQLTAALGALPPIEIPASLATVSISPSEQLTDASSLTQRALHASIALGGQPILDAVLGEAKVGAAGDACRTTTTTTTTTTSKTPGTSPVAGQSVADQLLACSDRKLVLVDVLKQNGRVKLLGAANRDYVGKRVAIRLRATGDVVAHATVQKDGSFETTAPLPAQAYFATHEKANSVRYRAEIGKELSLPLKLQRRLIVSSLASSKDGKTVKITGRVVRPLTTPVATVRVVRRVSCHKVVLVKRFTPRADGTFSVTVPAPRGQAAAIYRLATSVREKASNPRSYPTFTLPRGVALNTR
ncbi:MAG TPA: hypothetical protein VNT55_08395 [Baekduia sp.]|nr:hypothetical protein [Baekduia sp.]